MIDIQENIAGKKQTQHLQKETVVTQTVYETMLERIRLLCRRRVGWLRKIWTDAGTKNNPDQNNYNTEVDGCLDNLDVQGKEHIWYEQEQSLLELNLRLREIDNCLKNDGQSRLSRLKHTFGLNELETDIIQACLALYIDPNLGRVYAYLHDHNGRTYVTRHLVSRLFGYGDFLAMGSSSPLLVWNIITETDMGRSEPARIDLDPFIRDWLLGTNDIDGNLVGIVKVQPVLESLSNWPVDDLTGKIRRKIDIEGTEALRIFIAGMEGTGRQSFAAVVASRLSFPLLTIQTNRITPEQWPLFYMYAQRQAWLSRTALLWHGAFVFENSWPGHIPAYPLQFVIGEADEVLLPNDFFVDIKIALPSLLPVEAIQVCKKLIPDSGDWPRDEFDQMIRRQQLSIGSLVAISKQGVRTVDEASEALRRISRHRLGNFAQLMSSSFSWNDLVVESSLRTGLNDFHFEATERNAVWEDASIKKLFPQGRGLVALFSGPPGTGKTMAAQVIANSLQLDLFRIDLSSVVSKYVGETSKNIERILSRAAQMNVVLLFDEADSLFGKRTEIKDAHDRFANTDTNYLLQAIEEYPGIVILASNRKAYIDSGFMRRLRYVLNFPKPDAPERLRLWGRLIAELTNEKTAMALQKDLLRLSEMFEVTGAQIKLSVLSGIFMARQGKKEINISHLLKGLERELSKENRVIGKAGHEIMKQYADNN